MPSSKKSNNKKKFFNLKTILKILLLISFEYLTIYFIQSVNAESRECYNKIDSQWAYRMTLTDTNAFDQMTFACRVFGDGCDSNHPSLNPMQKEAMKIYNMQGRNGDYMKIVYKYSKKYLDNLFEKLFCNTDTFQEINFTFGTIIACPKTLRCGQLSYWTTKCANSKDINDRCPIKKFNPWSG